MCENTFGGVHSRFTEGTTLLSNTDDVRADNGCQWGQSPQGNVPLASTTGKFYRQYKLPISGSAGRDSFRLTLYHEFTMTVGPIEPQNQRFFAHFSCGSW
jgi:hypothetical protein